MEYTIDATNKSLGRLASEAASKLMGKNTTTFVRNTVPDARVTITNASKLKVDQRKLESKKYVTYSGYPGGLKQRKMEHVVKEKGYKEVVIHAVKGMLPDNKLKKEMLKHLIVTE